MKEKTTLRLYAVGSKYSHGALPSQAVPFDQHVQSLNCFEQKIFLYLQTQDHSLLNCTEASYQVIAITA